MKKDANINKKRVYGKPFKKGQSGNPTGRPKQELTMQRVLSGIFKELDPDCSSRTNQQAIAYKAVELARAGTPWAVQWVVDRVDGKVADQINLKKENPLEELSDADLFTIMAMKAKEKEKDGRGDSEPGSA